MNHLLVLKSLLILIFILYLKGPLAIGTPGEVLAYRKAYEQFGGGVPWSTLFSPTIRLCEQGFKVSHALAYAINKNKDLILNDTQLRYIKLRSFIEKVYWNI
jgi:gamma-glutamyltranspeptidase